MELVNKNVVEEIKNQKKILWLASWYPGEYELTNGDFVQRHARALSLYTKVDVIHVAQAGIDVPTKKNTTIDKEGSLTEYNYSFHHNPLSISFLNKVFYNLRYLSFYKKILKQYIADKGMPDIVHVHAPMKAGILALWLKKKYGIPFVVTEHSSMYDPAAKDNFFYRSSYFKNNTTKVFKQAESVTCVSDAIGQMIKNIFHLSTVKVIHNVVQTDLFYLDENRSADVTKPFVWLHVSSMYPLKNVEGMIQAFARVEDSNKGWQLRLVGPPNASVLKLIKDVGLEHKIVVVGELPYDSVAQEMKAANAFVMFSKHENFPCVIAEAHCCGIPVIASDVGGISEAVNVENGILVPSENIEVLAHSITVLMKNYAYYNAKDIAEKAKLSYSEETIGKLLMSLYQ